MSKGVFVRYTARQLAWIKRNRRLSRRELHAVFIRRFRRQDVTLDHLKSLCTRRGWRTGRDGRLQPGNVPANKGKKMPYNAKRARTQFKKGVRTGRAHEIYKPIGSERFSKEGYIERKIHDGLPMQSRWRAVHILNWEALHDPVPKGHVLKCLDGDKRNTDPSNWELISRGVLVRLNKRWRSAYSDAPGDLKATMLIVAKLDHRLGEKRREAAR